MKRVTVTESFMLGTKCQGRDNLNVWAEGAHRRDGQFRKDCQEEIMP